MKSVSVAVPLNGDSVGAPRFAVFSMSEQDLKEISSAERFLDETSFSQVRRQVFNVELDTGADEVYTPEVVIERGACWLSVKAYDYAGGMEFVSETIELTDLSQAFEDSAESQLFLFGDNELDLWRALSSDSIGRWSERVIGFQVANPETGEFWEDEPSFVVLTSYEQALQNLTDAKHTSGGWQLDAITLNGIEDPIFS